MTKVGGHGPTHPLWSRTSTGAAARGTGLDSVITDRNSQALPAADSNRLEPSPRSHASTLAVLGSNPNRPSSRGASPVRGAVPRRPIGAATQQPDNEIDDSERKASPRAAAAASAATAVVRTATVAAALATNGAGSARSATAVPPAAQGRVDLHQQLQQRLQALEDCPTDADNLARLQAEANAALSLYAEGRSDRSSQALAWLNTFSRSTLGGALSGADSTAMTIATELFNVPAPTGPDANKAMTVSPGFAHGVDGPREAFVALGRGLTGGLGIGQVDAVLGRLRRAVPPAAMMTDAMVQQHNDIEPGKGDELRALLERRHQASSHGLTLSKMTATAGAHAAAILDGVMAAEHLSPGVSNVAGALAGIVEATMQSSDMARVPGAESLQAAHQVWAARQAAVQGAARVDVPQAQHSIAYESLPMFHVKTRPATIAAHGTVQNDFADAPPLGVLAKRIAAVGVSILSHAGMAAVAPVSSTATGHQAIEESLKAVRLGTSIAALFAMTPWPQSVLAHNATAEGPGMQRSPAPGSPARGPGPDTPNAVASGQLADAGAPMTRDDAADDLQPPSAPSSTQRPSA